MTPEPAPPEGEAELWAWALADPVPPGLMGIALPLAESVFDTVGSILGPARGGRPRSAPSGAKRGDDKDLDGRAGAYEDAGDAPRTECVCGELWGEKSATAAMTSSIATPVPEETPGSSPGLASAGPETDGAGAAVTTVANSASSGAGDCCPKLAVLGRENMESPEPELAMAIDLILADYG